MSSIFKHTQTLLRTKELKQLRTKERKHCDFLKVLKKCQEVLFIQQRDHSKMTC